eukprot:jgi/Phyca11/101178/e_gw1.5.1068.1
MTLRNDNWLNDAIITYYFRTMLAPYDRTYVMDPNLLGYIYNEYKLENRKMLDAYKTCCGVTTTFPYETYDRIIVPICMGYHWTKLWVDTSMKSNERSFHTKKVAFIVRAVVTSPRQANADDCGVFLLFFIKRAFEHFLQDNKHLLSDITTICTAPRSARFMRKNILDQLTHSCQ